MSDLTILLWLAQLLVVLLAISLGKSLTTLKMHREATHRKEVELGILDKRARILEEGKKIAVNLEDLIYRAQVQKEIDDIIRKSDPR